MTIRAAAATMLVLGWAMSPSHASDAFPARDPASAMPAGFFVEHSRHKSIAAFVARSPMTRECVPGLFEAFDTAREEVSPVSWGPLDELGSRRDWFDVIPSTRARALDLDGDGFREVVELTTTKRYVRSRPPDDPRGPLAHVLIEEPPSTIRLAFSRLTGRYEEPR